MTPLTGHLWTVLRTVQGRVRPPRPLPATRPWLLELESPERRPIRLTGFATPGRSERAALLIHGLGGSAESSYLFPIERELVGRGWGTLRLNLRGADRLGDDVHHAGLIADLPQVLDSPPFRAAVEVAIVGASLGGHVALRYAADAVGRRPTAVVAICPPLDLELGARVLDRPGAWLYRRYLLSSLTEVFAAVDRRGRGWVPLAQVRRARTIREWDRLVIAPRFGFRSAEEYYARESVAPRLGEIATAAWIVISEADPMVPPQTLRAALAGVSASVEVTRTSRGGHVGFPGDLSLGRAGATGLAAQVAAWVDGRSPRPAPAQRALP